MIKGMDLSIFKKHSVSHIGRMMLHDGHGSHDVCNYWLCCHNDKLIRDNQNIDVKSKWLPLYRSFEMFLSYENSFKWN